MLMKKLQPTKMSKKSNRIIILMNKEEELKVKVLSQIIETNNKNSSKDNQIRGKNKIRTMKKNSRRKREKVDW